MVEPAKLRQRRSPRDRGGAVGERAAEPGADRGDEAHLGPIKNLIRQMLFERALHQPFPRAAAKPHLRRQTGCEFDQPMIEQGLARLQAHGHARPVDLGQDVAGKPDLEIGILRA